MEIHRSATEDESNAQSTQDKNHTGGVQALRWGFKTTEEDHRFSRLENTSWFGSLRYTQVV